MRTPTCSVPWCVREEPEHFEHRSRDQLLRGDVVVGMDLPEREGELLRVVLDSPTDEPRLAITVMTATTSLSVRLSAEATRFAHELLRESWGG